MPWVSLCEMSELVEGKGKYVEVEGSQLAVFLHEGEPRVVDNTCPHAGGSMAGGFVSEGCAVCPWHYWHFDLKTGEMPGRPIVKIRSYKTRILKREGHSDLVQADVPMP